MSDRMERRFFISDRSSRSQTYGRNQKRSVLISKYSDAESRSTSSDVSTRAHGVMLKKPMGAEVLV